MLPEHLICDVLPLERQFLSTVCTVAFMLAAAPIVLFSLKRVKCRHVAYKISSVRITLAVHLSFVK